MYKFTNGIVVYDKKIADNYIKAGYKLAKQIADKICEEMEKGAPGIEPVGFIKELNEENSTSNKSISKTNTRTKKTTGTN